MKKMGLLISIISVFIFFGYKPEVHAADLYLNYQELAAAKILGTDYKIVNRKTPSSTAVIAIHGGSIEPGTSEIADNIAGTKHDFYSFYGIMSSNNSSLHITSTNFNEPIALNLVQNSRNTLSIHGFSSTANITYIGGIDSILVAKVKTKLKAAGFIVEDAPLNLAGIETTNIANRNLRKAGVQIEISSALRSTFFESLSTSGRATKTTQFYKYTNAIKSALSY